jgi:site-specific recombinase XerD
MLNRENWKLIKAYLEYRKSVDQISESSLEVEATYLRYILEWAREISFQDAEKIRPTLPEYILTVRRDGKKAKLSVAIIKKTLATARRFFTWASISKRGYKRISLAWINSLKPKRLTEPPKSNNAVTLEEIKAIALAPVESTAERRIRAAAVFWYLSGIRIGAFVSLPLLAVDIKKSRSKAIP